jgi:hypothetical protein
MGKLDAAIYYDHDPRAIDAARYALAIRSKRDLLQSLRTIFITAAFGTRHADGSAWVSLHIGPQPGARNPTFLELP